MAHRIALREAQKEDEAIQMINLMRQLDNLLRSLEKMKKRFDA
jgi:hypothetical protein